MCCSLTWFLLCFWLLVEGSKVPASPGSLASVIGSVGLKDVDLSEDGSELAARLHSLLTGDWILRLPYIRTWSRHFLFIFFFCSFLLICSANICCLCHCKVTLSFVWFLANFCCTSSYPSWSCRIKTLEADCRTDWNHCLWWKLVFENECVFAHWQASTRLPEERPVRATVRCKRRGRGNPVHLIGWPPSWVCPPTVTLTWGSSRSWR